MSRKILWETHVLAVCRSWRSQIARRSVALTCGVHRCFEACCGGRPHFREHIRRASFRTANSRGVSSETSSQSELAGSLTSSEWERFLLRLESHPRYSESTSHCCAHFCKNALGRPFGGRPDDHPAPYPGWVRGRIVPSSGVITTGAPVSGSVWTRSSVS